MSHPSIYLLQQFVDDGTGLDEGLVAHVSVCAGCSASLRRLAGRGLRARGVDLVLARPAPEPHTTALAAFMAVAAALVVMVARAPLVAGEASRIEVTAALAPEGVHGIPPGDALSWGHHQPVLADGGAHLGSE